DASLSGHYLQETFQLDPTSEYWRGRLLSLVLASGIDRASMITSRSFVGRRLRVTGDGHGGWHSERPTRSKIGVTADIVGITDEAQHALLQDDGVYVRAGALVRVIRHDAHMLTMVKKRLIAPPTGLPMIDMITGPHLRERVARSAGWSKIKKDGSEV